VTVPSVESSKPRWDVEQFKDVGGVVEPTFGVGQSGCRLSGRRIDIRVVDDPEVDYTVGTEDT